MSAWQWMLVLVSGLTGCLLLVDAARYFCLERRVLALLSSRGALNIVQLAEACSCKDYSCLYLVVNRLELEGRIESYHPLHGRRRYRVKEIETHG